MKFKQHKISRLNESVCKSLGLTDDKKVDVVGTLNPTEVEAVNSEIELKKKQEEIFETQKKTTDEFIDENHDRDTEVVKDGGLKKMKLSESLFDDFDEEEVVEELDEEDEDGWGETVENALEEFFDLTEKLAYEIRHCKRGTYALRGNKVEDLISMLNNISEELTDAIDTIENQTDSINEATAVAEPETKKRTRAPNEIKEKGNFSSEDLWLAVYDELSAEVDNEGEGKEVNKQLKARRGERYEKVLPIGDSDIVVYATKPEEFEFAKKVAEYYEVTYDEPKLDRNKATNDYYKYSMRIHIPVDDLYDWDNN